MKNFKLFLRLTLIIFVYISVSAQETEPQAKLFFSVFPLEPGNWRGIYYSPSGEPENDIKEIKFNPHERSVLYKYEGPSPIRFFRKKTVTEDQILFSIVAEAVVSPTTHNAPYIYFFQPGSDGGLYDISIMENSPQQFPDESLVFYNTMNITFHGLIGEDPIMIAPGASAPFSIKEFFQDPTPIVIAIEQDNEFHFVLRNRIRFAPERKTILILRPPKSKTSFRIRTQRLTEFTGDRGTHDDPGR